MSSLRLWSVAWPWSPGPSASRCEVRRGLSRQSVAVIVRS